MAITTGYEYRDYSIDELREKIKVLERVINRKLGVYFKCRKNVYNEDVGVMMAKGITHWIDGDIVTKYICYECDEDNSKGGD